MSKVDKQGEFSVATEDDLKNIKMHPRVEEIVHASEFSFFLKKLFTIILTHNFVFVLRVMAQV